jgi:hypothetical protein
VSELDKTPISWRTSSASGGDNCVQVAFVNDARTVLIRDSKDPAGGVLSLSATEWTSFIVAVRAGDFDVA